MTNKNRNKIGKLHANQNIQGCHRTLPIDRSSVGHTNCCMVHTKPASGCQHLFDWPPTSGHSMLLVVCTHFFQARWRTRRGELLDGVNWTVALLYVLSVDSTSLGCEKWGWLSLAIEKGSQRIKVRLVWISHAEARSVQYFLVPDGSWKLGVKDVDILMINMYNCARF